MVRRKHFPSLHPVIIGSLNTVTVSDPFEWIPIGTGFLLWKLIALPEFLRAK